MGTSSSLHLLAPLTTHVLTHPYILAEHFAKPETSLGPKDSVENIEFLPLTNYSSQDSTQWIKMCTLQMSFEQSLVMMRE